MSEPYQITIVAGHYFDVFGRWRWKVVRGFNTIGCGFAFTEERARRKAQRVAARDAERRGQKRPGLNYTYPYGP